MKINKLLIGLLLVSVVACNDRDKEKVTSNGLKFKIVKHGTGVPAKPGEVLLFNFIWSDSKDSVWRNSYEMVFPPFVHVPDTMGMKNEDGLMQMLRMVSSGDSIQVDLTVDEFFEKVVKSAVPPGFDSTISFNYKFKIEGIMASDSFMTYQREFYERKSKEAVTNDSIAIDSFLAKSNVQAQKTESGVRYVITQAGKGENGKPGQTAEVRYSGHTLDGKYFDSNDKALAIEKGLYDPRREPYSTYPVTIDQSMVIKGWHDALKVLNKGAKATIYVPSHLAYGPQGRGEVIKPFQVLVFDLEVVDLKDVDLKDKKNEK